MAPMQPAAWANVDAACCCRQQAAHQLTPTKCHPCYCFAKATVPVVSDIEEGQSVSVTNGDWPIAHNQEAINAWGAASHSTPRSPGDTATPKQSISMQGARAHRNDVVVQDSVLVGDEAEVHKVRERPEHVVCRHSLDEFALHPTGDALLMLRYVTMFSAILAMKTVLQTCHLRMSTCLHNVANMLRCAMNPLEQRTYKGCSAKPYPSLNAR